MSCFKRWSTSIVSGFSPEQVILFGSYVWGRPHSNSDVDLLVVMKIEEDPVDVEARILLQCRPPFVPMDVLVRPPEEIAERLGRGDFFIRRILQQGRLSMTVQLEEWINKAEQDWQAALHLVEGRPEEAPDVIAFHAQQTAEKYLKALLVQVGEEPPRVHSLGAVLDAVAVYQPEAEALREDAASLSAFAVRFRYPGDSASVDRAREAVERARCIITFVRAEREGP